MLKLHILLDTAFECMTFDVPDGGADVQGLFRKVLFGELPPFRLVRLSNESLGSRELARWHDSASSSASSELVKVCFCVFTICVVTICCL